MSDISPHAVIDPGASIAADARIGPFSRIGAEVTVGAGCIIDNNVTITGRTVLGEKSRVYPMAVVGAAGDGGQSHCVIGKATHLREHVIVRGGSEGKPTRIGNDNLIMISSQVGAGAQVGDHGIFANCTSIGAGAKVEDYVRSSAFAVVQPGVTVGAYTFVNGYACVDHDAPPFAIVQGDPFRVRGVNAENLRRCGFGEDDIRTLREIFRDLFDGQTAAVNAEALKLCLASENVHVRRLAEALRAGGAEASA